MTVLSDKDIMKEKKIGNLIINPFDITQLSNTSYDVTLGENYYTPCQGKTIINPFSKKLMECYWGEPKKADIINFKNESQIYDLPIGTKIIKILPHETILAHTNEFIGGVKGITTLIQTRSSIGRCGLNVCKCAGWGDIGYINRWTMEITNFTNSVVVLPVGCKIGQIVFMYAGETNNPYNSKYHTSNDVETIIKNWNPEMMLPKTFEDKLIMQN